MWKVTIKDLYEQDVYENVLESLDESNNWVAFKIDDIIKLTEVSGPMEDTKYQGSDKRYNITIEEIGDVESNLAEVQRILTKTDWLFIADVVIDKEYRVEFKKYREYLRKLPRTTKIEEFESWLRRTRPELFLEGRSGPKMVNKFKTYL